MRPKTPLTLFGAILYLTLVGCNIQEGGSSQVDTTRRTSSYFEGEGLSSTTSFYLSGDNRIYWTGSNLGVPCNLIISLNDTSNNQSQILLNQIIDTQPRALLPEEISAGLDPYLSERGTTELYAIEPGEYYFAVNSTCRNWVIDVKPS
jgi:hypothetical protein